MKFKDFLNEVGTFAGQAGGAGFQSGDISQGGNIASYSRKLFGNQPLKPRKYPDEIPVKMDSINKWTHQKFEQYLLNENEDLDQQLIDASTNGRLYLVKQLIDQGADINAENDQALRLASENGYLEVVKYLIGKGADIHAYNDLALRYASYRGHLEVVKYLISKGADIPKLMDIPEDVQEIAIKNDVGNIKNIKNLRSDLKKRYKHLLQAKGFGLFNDD
jgi:ankyrin repeat protein